MPPKKWVDYNIERDTSVLKKEEALNTIMKMSQKPIDNIIPCCKIFTATKVWDTKINGWSNNIWMANLKTIFTSLQQFFVCSWQWKRSIYILHGVCSENQQKRSHMHQKNKQNEAPKMLQHIKMLSSDIWLWVLSNVQVIHQNYRKSVPKHIGFGWIYNLET